ncbi:MAG: hypothetical protein ABGZ24_08890, partial [Fuerstiella sp.]
LVEWGIWLFSYYVYLWKTNLSTTQSPSRRCPNGMVGNYVQLTVNDQTATHSGSSLIITILLETGMPADYSLSVSL